VEIVDGAVLHSKKDGDGEVTPAKLEVIVAGVEKVLGVSSIKSDDDDKDEEVVSKSPRKKASPKKVVAKKPASNGKAKKVVTKSPAKKRKAAKPVADAGGSPVSKRTRRK